MKYSHIEAFQKHLLDASPNHFADVYFVLGKEDFECREAVDLLTRSLLRGQKVSETNVCHFIGGEEKTEQLLEELNERPFQKHPYSRKELFAQVEQETLQPLPITPYTLARWRQETVNGGYHIQANEHYYSVPYAYVRKKVDIRITIKDIKWLYASRSFGVAVFGIVEAAKAILSMPIIFNA